MHKYYNIKANDLADILAIENSVKVYPWTKTMFQDCLNAHYICWTLKDATEIIGFIIFSLAAEECEILNLCIKSSKQHQGYGTILLQKTLQYTKQHNAKKVFLDVRASNQAAINLYHNLGFNELGRRKNYYGCEDAIMLGSPLL